MLSSNYPKKERYDYANRIAKELQKLIGYERISAYPVVREDHDVFVISIINTRSSFAVEQDYQYSERFIRALNESGWSYSDISTTISSGMNTYVQLKIIDSDMFLKTMKMFLLMED